MANKGRKRRFGVLSILGLALGFACGGFLMYCAGVLLALAKIGQLPWSLGGREVAIALFVVEMAAAAVFGALSFRNMRRRGFGIAAGLLFGASVSIVAFWVMAIFLMLTRT
ncbi:MAG TPA: hypothetical protein VGI19_19235 [Candidatus Cybelea sp.]|jgi:hypothetical protein